MSSGLRIGRSRPGSVVIIALVNAIPTILTKVGAAPANWPGAKLVQTLASSDEPVITPGSPGKTPFNRY